MSVNNKNPPPHGMTVREGQFHYKYENAIVSVAYRREMSNLVSLGQPEITQE